MQWDFGSTIVVHRSKAMKSQVLYTVWYDITGEAAGEVQTLSLSGVKGLITVEISPNSRAFKVIAANILCNYTLSYQIPSFGIAPPIPMICHFDPFAPTNDKAPLSITTARPGELNSLPLHANPTTLPATIMLPLLQVDTNASTVITQHDRAQIHDHYLDLDWQVVLSLVAFPCDSHSGF